MKVTWDSVMTVVLVACALATTGLVIRRSFSDDGASSVQSRSTRPVFVRNWQSQFRGAELVGIASAPVQVVEFADFECPFCAGFHKTLKTVQERFPNQIAVTYVHFPLPMHRFALPAARVAECAGEQGRFESMYDQLYDGQDSFGLKPWSDYAIVAGVTDVEMFNACVSGTGPIARVEEGKRLGTRLDVKGTPTVIVNGWKLGQPPTLEQLEGMVKSVLAGKSPVAESEAKRS
jgi:protein-disulfide isomerase